MESSTVLWYLAGVAVRSLGLAALAAIGMLIFRVKSAAVRHAVWTVVVAGMLALAAFEPLLPALPVPVLRAAPAPTAQYVPQSPELPVSNTLQPTRATPPQRQWPTWPQAVVAVYTAGLVVFLVRLAFGYLFTRRLVRASRPIDRPWAPALYESNWISVPLTVGWLRPKILLPAGWEQWQEDKLQAVLAHERTHVERADWAIAVLAGLNRCVFWFHPLAWWLERRLASLAEQACDDSALLLVATESYAQALLDMAAAVKTGRGRLVWEAMAMANATEVRKRIERILDETRQIPKGLTRSRWAALIAGTLPLIYVASVVQPVPAQAPPPAIQELLAGKRQIAPADAGAMEQYLAANPHDLDARRELIGYYFTGGTREQRLGHIFWLIANHPESTAAVFTSRLITSRTTTFNDASDFVKAASLWKQQAAARSTDTRVLGNAAEFLSQAGGDFNEAERLLIAARSIEPQNFTWRDKLAYLYKTAIAGSAGDPKFPNLDPAFADHVKLQLESSTDGMLLGWTGRMLASTVQRPEMNLNDHPMLRPVVDMGNRLIARGEQYGFPAAPAAAAAPAPATLGMRGAGATPAPQTATAAPTLNSAPPLIDKVDPAYPPLARQARIQGTVRLMASIGADGRITHLQVISGHPLLVPATLEAVKQWVYSPVASVESFVVDVPFSLPPRNESTPQGVMGGVAGGVAGGVKGGVLGGIIGSTPANGRAFIQVGENVQAAKLISKVEPVYPPLAKAAGIEGTAVLDVTIGEDGHVQSVRNKDGHPLLVAAAIEAVRQWVYNPTLLNGNPVVVMTTVSVTFQ